MHHLKISWQKQKKNCIHFISMEILVLLQASQKCFCKVMMVLSLYGRHYHQNGKMGVSKGLKPEEILPLILNGKMVSCCEAKYSQQSGVIAGCGLYNRSE